MQVTCFNNPDVERAVSEALAEAGVAVYSGHVLSEWNDGQENVYEIRTASFTSDEQPLRIDDCIVSYRHFNFTIFVLRKGVGKVNWRGTYDLNIDILRL